MRVGRMLKAAVKPGSPETTTGKVVPITAPRFARTTAHFQTLAARAPKEAT